MKATTLFYSVLISTFSFSGYAQTSVDALKKEVDTLKAEKQKLADENNFLNQKLEFCNLLSKDKPFGLTPFSDIYDIKLLKCKGNRVNQTVIIELVVSHKTTNQNLKISSYFSKAVDVLAKEYNASETMVGTSGETGIVFTETPVRVKATFKNILPGTEAFKSVMLQMATANLDDSFNSPTFTQINNLPIEW